jgi:hypothetical protein
MPAPFSLCRVRVSSGWDVGFGDFRTSEGCSQATEKHQDPFEEEVDASKLQTMPRIR